MLGLRVDGLASGLIQCVRYTLYVPTFVFDLNSLLGWNGALRRLIIPLVNTTLVYFCDNFEPWKLHALSPFFSLYCLSYDIGTAWVISSLLNIPMICIVFKSFRTHPHTLKNGEHDVSSQPRSSSHEQKSQSKYRSCIKQILQYPDIHIPSHLSQRRKRRGKPEKVQRWGRGEGALQWQRRSKNPGLWVEEALEAYMHARMVCCQADEQASKQVSKRGISHPKASVSTSQATPDRIKVASPPIHPPSARATLLYNARSRIDRKTPTQSKPSSNP